MAVDDWLKNQVAAHSPLVGPSHGDPSGVPAPWVPACAGMTQLCNEYLRGSRPRGRTVRLSNSCRPREGGDPGNVAAFSWVPACAGMTELCTKYLRGSRPRGRTVRLSNSRRPRAGGDPGNVAAFSWVPAYAGMTQLCTKYLRGSRPRGRTVRLSNLVVPAQAGPIYRQRRDVNSFGEIARRTLVYNRRAR